MKKADTGIITKFSLGGTIMPTNRNQIRADAIELAVMVNKVLENIKDKNFYVEQMQKSLVLIGSNITSLRNLRDEISIVRRINIAIDACSELIFVAKLLSVEELISDEDYKIIKKNVQSIERRMISSLSD